MQYSGKNEVQTPFTRARTKFTQNYIYSKRYQTRDILKFSEYKRIKATRG